MKEKKEVFVIFLLKENKKTIERHLVKIPEVYEENFSKDATSIAKFENDEKERIFKHTSIPPERIAVGYRYDEWKEEQESMRDRMINLRGIKDFKHEWDDSPLFEHETIWDLYKAIGYNHKNKRYNEAKNV